MPQRRRTFFEKTLSRAQKATGKFIGSVSSVTDPYYGVIEVTKVNLPMPRLGTAFHLYQVLQISDIHLDDEMSRDYLNTIVELVNEQQADLVVITGDFVTTNAERYARSLIALLRRVQARDGVLAVMGNHDHLPWSNPSTIRQVLEESEVVLLDNRVYTLECENEELHIAGIDDVCGGHDRLDVVMQALPPQGSALLLCHVPDFADTSAQSGRFDLQLSGHSHGGQVFLPGFGNPVLPKHGRKYPSGLYKIEQMHLYTNRGLGHPQMRFNCRPEITVFSLLAPSVNRRR
jgi:hypothetical protein